MRNRKWKANIFWVGISELVGIVAGLLSMEGMRLYDLTAMKPKLTPPGWVFPVVWTALYALMGIAAARVSLSDSPRKQPALNLFIIQLIINFFWPLLFFNAGAYGFAFLWLILLWILVLTVLVCFYHIDETAGYLLVPYLLWLTFAAYLNYRVYLMK